MLKRLAIQFSLAQLIRIRSTAGRALISGLERSSLDVISRLHGSQAGHPSASAVPPERWHCPFNAQLLLLVAKAACLQQVLGAPACVRIGRPALLVLCTWPCLVQHVVAVGR